MRIIIVADRPGWAIDRLSKPLSKYDDTDMSYFSVSPKRYLDSGYSDWKGATHYTHELGNKYDIVHFHRLDAAVIGIEKLKARKILTVHTERHKDYEDERLLLFDDIICPTKYAKEYLEKQLKHPKVHYVPHGIDLDKYKVMNELKEGNVGYVGRIVPWKRYSQIQKAIHSADLKLVGCGYIENGPTFSQNNFKEGEDYEWTTFLPETMMTKFYNEMGLFICLSEPHIEAGPLPVMEAMACGIPVISTRVGWAVDNCEHKKNIYFVDEEEVTGVTNIIKKVHNDKELKQTLRKNALELIKDFGLKQYEEKIRKIYGV